MIRTVISDLGKVLLEFDHHRSCRELSKWCGLEPDRIFQEVFGSGLVQKYELGLIASEEFGRGVVDLLGVELSLDRLKAFWSEIFEPMEGMTSLIKRLKGRYRLVLLSNTNAWHFEYCRDRFEVVRLFDAFALSYRLGMRKPEPRIFHEALALAEAAPEDCIYVDDIEDYAEAARNVGIHGFTFKTVATFRAELERLGVNIG